MGFGDWIKGLFGKKDEAESTAPPSEASGDAAGSDAETAAAGGGGAADTGQPSDPSAS